MKKFSLSSEVYRAENFRLRLLLVKNKQDLSNDSYLYDAAVEFASICQTNTVADLARQVSHTAKVPDNQERGVVVADRAVSILEKNEALATGRDHDRR